MRAVQKFHFSTTGGLNVHVMSYSMSSQRCRQSAGASQCFANKLKLGPPMYMTWAFSICGGMQH